MEVETDSQEGNSMHQHAVRRSGASTCGCGCVLHMCCHGATNKAANHAEG